VSDTHELIFTPLANYSCGYFLFFVG